MIVVGGAVVGATTSSGVACAGSTCVYTSAPGAPRPGVGSKATHPTPEKYTSGQAWLLRPRTTNVPVVGMLSV